MFAPLLLFFFVFCDFSDGDQVGSTLADPHRENLETVQKKDPLSEGVFQRPAKQNGSFGEPIRRCGYHRRTSAKGNARLFCKEQIKSHNKPRLNFSNNRKIAAICRRNGFRNLKTCRGALKKQKDKGVSTTPI